MYKKDRLRRSMMFVPGNNPGMIRDAHIYGSDSIMFDLEDSVAYNEKDAARFLVYNALRTLHFGKKEIVVRINDLSSGLGIEDLEAVVRAGVQVVRLPKTDSAQDVIDCEREIERIERAAGIPVGTTGMMAAIESANGVLNAVEIAKASDRLIGIALGAEDYVADLKTTRNDGIELLFARCMILNAARAPASPRWTRCSPTSTTRRASSLRPLSSKSWALTANPSLIPVRSSHCTRCSCPARRISTRHGPLWRPLLRPTHEAAVWPASTAR